MRERTGATVIEIVTVVVLSLSLIVAVALLLGRGGADPHAPQHLSSVTGAGTTPSG